MGDYHFVYKDVEGSSTQWDDIQRKLGNLPPKPPAFKPTRLPPLKTNLKTRIGSITRPKKNSKT
ncbi:hypothetical protein HanRHA438_Chr15g0698251 [Helianthus annuus]|uniref:Uncharacterized protein n=1 Tax=Helianthus annuus TaxID=4232 RepID=A0A9K3H1L9_HELAN|nr:hypothetical protein HanXRQr2_Chr15g0686111 [Helianthus annuus]KAJ0472537.1 hypothetical protein HanHA89_Chr15g0608151 [Helianthus annuus]KAJ0648139.1 hypothetical protein HanLR1_Chr15g0569521 [Helianthus annuus]KAJ0651986.1 hypothetical protein HanOQP8_Chr15g0567011 [Helianthus annuus]KAJ0830679.1 hypothetical protein HanPSC8_Chr15g0658161 [Helianthus annuus]